MSRMRVLLSSGLVAAAFLSAAPSVSADGDVIFNARLRYETVDQAGIAQNADGMTLRARLGYQTGDHNGFRFLVEGEAIVHFLDDFNSTTNGQGQFPVIADPEETELNRLQVAYSGFEDTTVTLGRQRLILGDARYIGNVGFRQNEQTFDALRVTNTSIENVTLNYAYLDRVHRIFGDDHPGGEFDLDAHAFMAAFNTEAGTLTGFGFLVDNEDVAGLSSSTWGVRWQGRFAPEGGPNFGYFVEYAHQSDYADNPANFDLGMFRAQASLSQNGWTGAIGIENLEGDGARGFSTPLATLHAYQGWADAFLATPASGVRDIYVRGGYAFPEAPFGEALSAALIYHDFEAESGGGDLGSEIDAVVTSRLNDHVSLQLKAAFYDGEPGGPAGRDKVWFAITFNR